MQKLRSNLFFPRFDQILLSNIFIRQCFSKRSFPHLHYFLRCFSFFFFFFSFFLVSSRCDELNLLHCNKMSKHSPLGNERRKINEENASSKRVYSFASLIKRYEKS